MIESPAPIQRDRQGVPGRHLHAPGQILVGDTFEDGAGVRAVGAEQTAQRAKNVSRGKLAAPAHPTSILVPAHEVSRLIQSAPSIGVVGGAKGAFAVAKTLARDRAFLKHDVLGRGAGRAVRTPRSGRSNRGTAS